MKNQKDKLFNLFKKKENYADQKLVLNSLIMDGGMKFDMKWFNKHQILIRHAFTKKAKLEIYHHSNASNLLYRGPLEGIILRDDKIELRARDFAIDFLKPSNGTIERKERGCSYEMHIHSTEDMLSELILSYYNI